MQANRVREAEKLIWSIVKQHFVFLKELVRRDSGLVDDINQVAQVAHLESNGDFKQFYNSCQRGLYALARARGWRRTRKNAWINNEQFGIF